MKTPRIEEVVFARAFVIFSKMVMGQSRHKAWTRDEIAAALMEAMLGQMNAEAQPTEGSE